jgi:hypothetical protein
MADEKRDEQKQASDAGNRPLPRGGSFDADKAARVEKEEQERRTVQEREHPTRRSE